MGRKPRRRRRPANPPLTDSAAQLLLVGAFRHYGWGHVPAEFQGEAWKAGAALCILLLIVRLWWRERGFWLGCVVAWMAWEELQVVLCSLAYSVNPWPVEEGQAVCSALVGLDLGALGLMFVALMAWRMSR